MNPWGVWVVGGGTHQPFCWCVRYFVKVHRIPPTPKDIRRWVETPAGAEMVIHKSVFDDEAEYECDAKTIKSSGMLTVVGKKT